MLALVVGVLAFLLGLTAGLVLHTVAHGQWTRDILKALSDLTLLHQDLDTKVTRLLPPEKTP